MESQRGTTKTLKPNQILLATPPRSLDQQATSGKDSNQALQLDQVAMRAAEE